MSKIAVLRLGHRITRDQRITTHIALVARAYGASEVIIAGERDRRLIGSVERVVERWGGDFAARFEDDWKKVIREWRKSGGLIVHLTMYGVNLPDIIHELREKWRSGAPLLVIVGGEKVPGEVFRFADYNVAISNQPHSEVAALATFLDWLHEGKELTREYPGAKLKVIPQLRGKKVVYLK
ncbi:MAG: tRNA (cytidine(56)-2'-O)-methyltransferase [Aigarchaeota archaeon]|nr:tRNA (cytidine(56)-2'-O)-methyltransferase [Aigarchaeota archaeon]MDW8021426.1 tRNA (cytidine(56)-2'-O)-methyltransferase [Nitrososphaerota archaeon]